MNKLLQLLQNRKVKYCSAVIVAAGNSSRMKGEDKLLMELCGKPVIWHSIRLFQTCPLINEIVVVTREDIIEKIKSLAQHGCTMVIFLSSGMLGKLAEELTKGAYTYESKAALVYKATWPEEKVIHTDLGHLAEDAEKNGISRTALVIVGDILNGIYERSRLYDPSFTTGYREATE